ncbi:chemotaxis protein CheB [Spiribacter halobius]|uniref:chemotaxis protein CheB n=1 Tax=Sediminicurvatus halobius TaxID=2182432 RepID=UPI001304AF96|nr:chemotaxis protein CheB [Spiribacter halobius]UEX78752.1 PAS domain-containing protein [Spiribacter halobius]
MSDDHRALVPVLQPPGDALWVVALGASAGGLEALKALLAAVEPAHDLAFVVVQHLSPDHETLLGQLLARETRLRVQTAEDGGAPAGGHVYITPANRHITLEAGRLRLAEAPRAPTPKPSIDRFLDSLARECHEHAVAVILSGTGSDGSAGVRAIKAAGGAVFVQDPESAKYDGMPRSALGTGCADRVGAPARIARFIQRLQAMPPGSELDPDAEDGPLGQVLRVVQSRTGMDLSAYKPSTLRRRLHRRLAATESRDLKDYLTRLQRSEAEARALGREVLISVTRFFRDAQAFEALRTALAASLRERGDGQPLRIWVPGCATGEEAYSIAFLAVELMGGTAQAQRLRIFATDLDGEAVTRARGGLYPDSALAELSEELVARCFEWRGGARRVRRDIRDLITFARHDLLADPPFHRIDLISCRNLLIYFSEEAKRRACRRFHYALREGGLLFLGRAETPPVPDLFESVDDRARLYRCRGGALAGPLEAGSTLGPGGETAPAAAAGVHRQAPRAAPLEQSVLRAAAHTYAPPGLLVDDGLRILHFLGDSSPFVSLPEGQPSFGARELLRPALRTEFVMVATRARRTGEREVSRVIAEAGAGGENVRLVATPCGEAGGGHVLVFFESADTPAVAADPPDAEGGGSTISTLEYELADTRGALETVKGEYEVTTEELQSTNEELQSANEELQSANEELQTSNEELQATNEELTTVNEELNQKSAELESAWQALDNVRNSLADALVVVDRGLRVMLWNPAAEEVFHWSDDPTGSDLTGIPRAVNLPHFRRDLQRVLASGEPVEREVRGRQRRNREARIWRLRLLPYLDARQSIAGVIVTLVEVTALRAAEASRQESEQRLASILRQASVAVVLRDRWRRYVYVNEAFSQAFGAEAPPPESEQPPPGLDGETAAALDALDAEVRAGRTVAERELATPAGERHFLFEAFPVSAGEGGAEWVCALGVEITQRRRNEARIRLQAAALEAASFGISVVDCRQPDQPLSYVNHSFERMTGYPRSEILGRNCRFLQGAETDPDHRARLREAIAAGQSCEVRILNYRRDGAPFWNEVSLSPVRDDSGRVTHYVGIQNDITAEIHARESLARSRERQRKALEFAGVGNFEWQPGPDRVTGSPRFWELFGLSGSEARPLPALLGRLGSSPRRVLEQRLHEALDTGEEIDERLQVIASGGGQRWLRLQARIDRDDREGPRVLGLVADVTLEREIETAMAEARRTAEAASRAKSQFLSSMSHELRTPLNAVLGFSELLLEEDREAPLAEAQRESVEHIRQAGDHLLRLVSEILDLARIESGRLALSLVPVSLAEALTESVQMIRPAAEEAALTLDIAEAPAGLRVQADPTRLQQVLLNLLSNAVKYNRRGGRLAVTLREEPGRVGVAVTDTGEGIAPEDQWRVFEPFDRLGRDREAIEGTGIGLVVARRLLEGMGGELSMESVPGEGSTFTAWLVSVTALLPEDAGSAPILAEARLPPCRLLCIEDQPANRALLRQWAHSRPAVTLVEAADGAEGLREAREQGPDAILLDLHLPGASGWEVLRQLRADAATRDIPVLAVTADVREDREEATHRAGFDGFLGKPFQFRELERLLADLLGSCGKAAG